VRRPQILCAQEQAHFTLWQTGRQRLEVTLDPGPLVSDAGLLAARALERSLGVRAELAARLPDPRAPQFVRHSAERLLAQQVYQILAGYPDGNDADGLRQDALFEVLADLAPAPDEPLASASTLTRFAYAPTRRAYGRRDPFVQRLEEVKGYQAQSGPHPRRGVAKVERTPQGSQRRFVVTDLPPKPDEVYRDFYVKRGAVPEQPLGELKSGLRADRLSACGFCANAGRLLVHVVAYALVVLLREANAEVAGVAGASVGTPRQRLWKVPAVVAAGARRVVRRLSAAGPWREVFGRVLEAVTALGARLAGAGAAPVAAPGLPS
jgi:hypothetical protein